MFIFSSFLCVPTLDLKPENLLLDSEGTLKISDFGLSALSSDFATGDVLHTICGTPNYAAPEVLMSSGDKGYDGRAADIWSSGIILYVLLAGFLPFDESSMVELFRKIVKADFAYPSTLSPEAVHLLSIILNPDPDKRATIEQIKSSAWYRGMTMEELAREEEAKLQLERERELAIAAHGRQPSAELNGSTSPDDARPSLHRMPSADTSQAITWVDQHLGSSSVSPLLRTHSLGISGPSNGSSGTTPTNPSLLTPNPSMSYSPSSSPAVTSTHPSPLGGSLQSRRQGLAHENENDPLGLDEDEADIKGPIPLNAFDLINMVGGAAMGRMFQRGNEKKIRAFTQFTTQLPLDEIITNLDLSLSNMSDTQHRIYPKQCIIKASRNTARGKIVGSCQIYQMTPKLFMIEWTKLRVSREDNNTIRCQRQGYPIASMFISDLTSLCLSLSLCFSLFF